MIVILPVYRDSDGSALKAAANFVKFIEEKGGLRDHAAFVVYEEELEGPASELASRLGAHTEVATHQCHIRAADSRNRALLCSLRLMAHKKIGHTHAVWLEPGYLPKSAGVFDLLNSVFSSHPNTIVFSGAPPRSKEPSSLAAFHVPTVGSHWILQKLAIDSRKWELFMGVFWKKMTHVALMNMDSPDCQFTFSGKSAPAKVEPESDDDAAEREAKVEKSREKLTPKPDLQKPDYTKEKKEATPAPTWS